MELDFRSTSINDVEIENSRTNERFFDAITSGDVKLVSSLIKEKANIHCLDSIGNLPLHHAACCGHAGICELLVKHKANVNDQNERGFSALHSAVMAGQGAMIKKLLSMKANLNSVNIFGENILHTAVQHQVRDLFPLLLQLGVDINYSNVNGETALYQAVSLEKEDLVMQLIELNADVNIFDEFGYTPLHRAIESGNQGIMMTLLNNKAAVTIQNKDSESPLHVAVSHGHPHIVKKLLEIHEDIVDLTDQFGESALHIASRHGFADIVMLLLSCKANTNITNHDGDTCLHLAALGRHEHTMELLRRGGADSMARNKIGLMAVDSHNEFGGFEPTPVVEADSHANAIKSLLDSISGSFALPMGVENLEYFDLGKTLEGINNCLSSIRRTDGGNANIHTVAMGNDVAALQKLIFFRADVNAANMYMNTALHFAASVGSKPMVESLVVCKANINAKNDVALTPLHVAAFLGHSDVVKFLMESKADVDVKDMDGRTPAMLAMYAFRISIVNMLVRTQANTAQNDKCGNQLLHVAVLHQSMECLEKLMQVRANVHSVNEQGETGLHCAARIGFEPAVKMLVEAKSNLNARDRNGCTPLVSAAINGHYNVINYLLSSGSDINIRNKHGDTVVHLIARNNFTSLLTSLEIPDPSIFDATNKDGISPLQWALFERHEDMVEQILKMRSNPNQRFMHQLSLLHFAAELDSARMCSSLISYRADPNAMDIFGCTPLHSVVFHSSSNAADVLIQCSNLNALTDNGVAPLHIATFLGQLDMVSKLLESNADPNIANARIEAPIIGAVSNRKIQLVECLLNHKADVNTTSTVTGEKLIQICIRKKFFEIFECLVEHDVDVDFGCDASGNTLLHTAVKSDNCCLAARLLQAQANPNVANKHEITPLYAAVQAQRNEIVDLLLGYKADPNFNMNKFGETMLHLSIRKRHLEIADKLVFHGADVNIRNEKGDTPLHIAVVCRDIERMKLLLACKADVAIMNLDRETPIHCAVLLNDMEAIELLVESELPVERSIEGLEEVVDFCWRKNMFETAMMILKLSPATLDPNGFSALHVSVLNNDMKTTKLLLGKRSNVNVKSREGFTALHYAIKMKNAAMVNLLLNGCADVSAPTQDGQSPIELATRDGSVDLMRILFTHGASVNTLLQSESSLLHLAIKLNIPSTISFLIESFADLNVRSNGDGSSPLFYAVKHSNAQVAKLLVDAEADASAKDFNGTTILRFLSQAKNKNEILDYIITTNPNAADERGVSLLHDAAQMNKYSIARRLLEAKANVHAHDRLGATPLRHAVRNRSREMVTMLIEYGSNVFGTTKDGETHLQCAERKQFTDIKFDLSTTRPTAQDSRGQSFLHIAALQNESRWVKQLVAAKAEVNVQDDKGWTPLYIAAENNSLKAAGTLLKLKADPNLATKDGVLPVDAAKSRGYSSIIEFLDFAVNPNGNGNLHRMIKEYSAKKVKFLIHMKANLSIEDEMGQKPLITAAACNSVPIFGLLLDAKANPNCSTKNGESLLSFVMRKDHTSMWDALARSGMQVTGEKGQSMLHLAAQSGDLSAVKQLMSTKADVNAKDQNGSTSLHTAIAQSQHEIVEYLIRCKADVHLPNNDGISAIQMSLLSNDENISDALVVAQPNAIGPDGRGPLHRAALEGNCRLIQKLIQANANMDALDQNGLSPLWLALQHNQLTTAEVLIKKKADINIQYDGETMESFAVRSGNDELHRLIVSSNSILVAAMERGDAAQILALDKPIDIRDINGRTALEHAVRNSNVEAVERLIAAKADVNIPSYQCNMSYLHLTAKIGDVRVAKILIESKANIEAVETSRGLTPLWMACRAHRPLIVKCLVDAKADTDTPPPGMDPFGFQAHLLHLPEYRDAHFLKNPNLPDLHGKTPLHVLVTTKNAILPLLIAARADVNARDENGESAIFITTYVEPFMLLINSGAHLNYQNIKGETLLHRIIKKKHVRLFTMVCNNTTTLPDVKDANLRTPLHEAVLAENEYFVKTLINLKADINSTDANGNSVLDLAISTRNHAACSQLIPLGAKASESSLQAVQSQNMGLLHLMTIVNNVGAEGEDGRFMLHTAVDRKDLDFTKLLITAKADTNVKDSAGATPLKNAVLLDATEIVDVLLDAGADPGIVAEDGENALDAAKKRGNASIVGKIQNKRPRTTNVKDVRSLALSDQNIQRSVSEEVLMQRRARFQQPSQ